MTRREVVQARDICPGDVFTLGGESFRVSRVAARLSVTMWPLLGVDPFRVSFEQGDVVSVLRDSEAAV